MEDKTSNPDRKKLKKPINLPLFGLAMFLSGMLVLIGLRFATLKTDEVHYHANFALYINGQRDEFKNFTFYEEVAACAAYDPDDVKARVHMHDKNPDLVHIHAHGVTWGQFFANLGYTLGDKVVVSDKGVYVNAQDDNKLVFLLNGQTVQTVEDRVIKTEDVLLIDYGKDDATTLKARYDAIPRNAHKANTEKDPAACSGTTNLNWKGRFKKSIGL